MVKVLKGSVKMKNVKMILVILVMTLIPVLSRAQFLGGFFNQKGTERKLLVQQIAALEVYKRYVKTGYKIVGGGIRTIRDIKSGDFGLHSNFFSALKRINPQIKRYAKVAEVIALQVQLVRSCGQQLKAVKQSGSLTEEELLYIGRVFSRLLEEAAALLDELITLTTDGRLEMKDSKRMERIDRLHGEALQQYSFLKAFNGETLQLVFARKEESRNIEKLKAIQGID